MSFAEFQIRLFAWKRTEDREWEKVRFVAWNALTGFHHDPRKLPKSIIKFLPLGSDKKTNTSLSEVQTNALMDAMAEYVKKTNNGK